MKRILKYLIKPTPGSHLANPLIMPSYAKPLRVDFEGNHLCLWAEVDESNPDAVYTFETFKTGEEMPELGKRFTRTYIGTTASHPLWVIHVYLITVAEK